ncbi:MAG: MBL fold metallo-hydrolase [Elusimicrobia bacterium]|nr:MBL fold metallo-hydrolase [Elusimicrobiota bacterium]
MIFRQLNPGACRTYLVASEKTKEALLIDPVLTKVDEYLKLLKDEGLRLKVAVDTHTHADHLSGCTALRDKTGASYAMHSSAGVVRVDKRLEDGETLGYGDATLQFLHAPGHTQDSLIVLAGGRLLSGDFLFIGEGGSGRLDLPGGSIHAHYDSLKRLDAMPGGTLMFPGHDYRGNAQSTLEAERASNPVLSPRSREEYLKWWESLRLGPAEWMKDVLKANVACVCDPNAVKIPQGVSACEACAPAGPSAGPAVPEWSPQEVKQKHAGGGVSLVDVREPEEYSGDLGHVRGATLIPLGQLGDRLAEVPKGAVVTICKSGRRSARAGAQLLAAGWKDVHSMAGGMEAWNEAGLPVEFTASV